MDQHDGVRIRQAGGAPHLLRRPHAQDLVSPLPREPQLALGVGQ